MDFITIRQRPGKGYIEIYPEFTVKRTKDIMIKSGKFYAIWDEEAQMWSTDIYDVPRLVDNELDEYAKKLGDTKVKVLHLRTYSNHLWTKFLNYIAGMGDNFKMLDRRITFANDTTKKEDYISKKVPYSKENIPIPAYTEMTHTLYDDKEIEKFEWIIGSIISGDSRSIQKFLVFYGPKGTGKSTIIGIFQDLFAGYYETFTAKILGEKSQQFPLEPFKNNPLVAIQHDGDLSRIEDNTVLNSLISHEPMNINTKNTHMYTDVITSMCIMGTNKPVKITDAQSGIIRRLIDVSPKGEKIPVKQYNMLRAKIKFELGGIAYHCLEVYNNLGKYYYDDYIPVKMIQKTDVFYNFMKEYFTEYSEASEITLKKAWSDYHDYCAMASIKYDMPLYKFREELKEYFVEYVDYGKTESGAWLRSFYRGLKKDKIFINTDTKQKKEEPTIISLNCTKSLLDDMLKDCPAQYAKEDGTPCYSWGTNKYKLKDLDTSKLHYIKPPLNHIVIDFDLKNDKGEKDFLLNAEAASKWPATYAELSKGGSGIHLHYIYDGDPEKLAAIYDKDIEIKVFKGKSSLRRKLSKCNDIEVAHISSGLPTISKGDKMINFEGLKNETALDTYIRKCLNKEYEPHATKPMINYIYEALEKAYNSGMDYDMSKWFNDIWLFASRSSNNKDYCQKKVLSMKWKSKSAEEETIRSKTDYDDDRLVFFDIEVFPNLLLVVWKYENLEKYEVMINPEPVEVKRLLKLKLIGFNCRRYDNHILYAAASGFSNAELYGLSKSIIKNQQGFIIPAYNVSYADIYDFSTKKQSLKKFEVDLGIHHQELPVDWNKPIPEDRIEEVTSYCKNDVYATEMTFHSLIDDYNARCIIAELAGMTPNDTTRAISEQFIFGDDKNPQSKFNIPDLSIEFPGYKFEAGKSWYKGELIGEGGYVYAEPGAYGSIPVMDVTSMHPNSAIAMNLFGDHTKRFKELVEARIAVKHEDKETASKLLGGILVKYMTDKDSCKRLAYALKIIINSIYGLTAASFNNRFRDPRNIDNVVAKRGALFMCQLKHEIQEKGFKVVHIKTDSIKVAEADEQILNYICERGKQYGYTFEIEEEFERFLLVNDAVYVGKLKDGTWDARGAEFIHPYVFKSLFSKEPIIFEDMCETKQVQTEMYLDFNENIGDKHRYHFVGKIGSFVPVKAGSGGGLLMRVADPDVEVITEEIISEEVKMSAVTGSKGYRWKEAEVIKDDYISQIDESYYNTLVTNVKNHISEFCDYDLFTSSDTFIANNVVYSNNNLNPDLPFDI